MAVAVFPELCLTGYAIDDLVLQDALLDAVEEAIAHHRRGHARPAAAGRRRRSAAPRQPGLQLRGRRSTAAGCSASRPSPTCPTYREFYERRRFAPGDDRRGASIDLGRRARCPSAPTCCSTPSTCPGWSLHVEVCEDMWVPVPPSAEAALAGATVLAQPLRQPDHRRPCRGPPPAGPQRQHRAAWRPTSTPRRGRASPPPTCRGTARR